MLAVLCIPVAYLLVRRDLNLRSWLQAKNRAADYWQAQYEELLAADIEAHKDGTASEPGAERLFWECTRCGTRLTTDYVDLPTVRCDCGVGAGLWAVGKEPVSGGAA